MNVSSDLGFWTMMSAESADGSAVFRVRTDRPADSAIELCSTAVIVRWDYTPAAAGMPDDATRQSMDQFEDHLGDLGASEGFSYLMLVTTGFGQREWTYYTCDPNQFVDRFNALLPQQPSYPVEVVLCRDPQWDYWQDVQQRCVAHEPSN